MNVVLFPSFIFYRALVYCLLHYSEGLGESEALATPPKSEQYSGGVATTRQGRPSTNGPLANRQKLSRLPSVPSAQASDTVYVGQSLHALGGDDTLLGYLQGLYKEGHMGCSP